MSVEINYIKKKISSPKSNYILFCNDKFNTNSLKKYLLNSEISYINDLLKSSDLKKNMLVFELNSKKKIFLISIKNNLKTSDIENLGAELYGRVNYGKSGEYFLNTETVLLKCRTIRAYICWLSQKCTRCQQDQNPIHSIVNL